MRARVYACRYDIGARYRLSLFQSHHPTSSSNVYAWGQNTNGRAGGGAAKVLEKPTIVSRGKNISQVTMGGRHAVAWSKDGRIYCTGARASIPPTIVDGNMDPKKSKKEAWTFEQCVWDDAQVVS